MILRFKKDRFGGVIILEDGLPSSAKDFRDSLEASLEDWTSQKFKLAWLTLPIAKVDFIPFAIGLGFVFHHATELQSTLVSRLIPDAFVPPYATHTCGAGGVVISPNNELLVVREVNETRQGFYKLPGGLLDTNEHIEKAVVREVFEETGIRTQFESLTSLAHIHQWQFAKSNIYFICRLQPLDFDITLDPGEIAEALWMPLDDYFSNTSIALFNKQIVKKSLNIKGLNVTKLDIPEFDSSRLEVYLPSSE
jgi:ADP-ribose pyrophosphatase YjhB (NUDIX family)